MARFADTPPGRRKPTKREEREEMVQAVTLKPTCPICGAKTMKACVTPDGKPRTVHPERRERARAAAASAERLGRLRRQRWSGVTVRFECPACGGDHPRAQCAAAAT
jgi:rRNA maturation protein Nop10